MFVVERQEAYLLDLKYQRLQFYKNVIDYRNELNVALNNNLNYVYSNISYYLNKNKIKLAY